MQPMLRRPFDMFASRRRGLLLSHGRRITSGIGAPSHPGQKLSTPSLRSAYVPESSVPKLSLYHLDGDWLVYYKKDGRPYYHNPKTGVTQWAHPTTGEVHPPAAPVYEKPPNPYVLGAVRIGGKSFFIIAGLGFFGFFPLMGRMLGEGKSHRVVQQARGR